MPETSPAARDAAARMAGAAQRASAFAHKAQEKEKLTPQEEQEEEEVVKVADQTSLELKMKDNPFYQTWEAKASETTQEEKILALANALDPKQQTIEQLRENYRLFEEYYTYIQSEELDQVLSNVKRLIDELQNRSKIEIAEILKNLRGMLDDISVSRDLVEVMRKCRLDGTTVKELAEAYDRNEQIGRNVRRLEGGEDKETGEVIVGERKLLADRLAASRRVLDSVIAEQRTGEATWGFWCTNLLKTNTTYSDRVALAKTAVDDATASLGTMDGQIADLKAEWRAEFEKEPLKILRAFDEADDNLSQRLVTAGQKGIATVQGAQKSTIQLLQRAFFSEGEVEKIARRVTEKRITLGNLRSGLVLASKNTNDFKLDLEAQSAKAEAEVTASKTVPDVDILAVARLEDTSLNLKGRLSDVIDYQGKLNNTANEITGTIAKNLEREQETDRNRSIVEGTKRSISMLGRDTLNTVAGNLEGVLHNLVADQTDEVQQSVIAFGESAQTMNAGMLQSQMGREKEMHQKDMRLIDDSIQRLQTTTNIIADALDQSVDMGIARADKQRQLEKAAEGLDMATTTFRKVVGEMSDSTTRGREQKEEPTQG